MTPARRRALAAVAAFVALALALALGCSRRDTDAPAVDMELMAYLSEARALHHQANLKEESGDLDGAAGAMKRLVAARRPHEGRAPEVSEVLADAYARLAELELRRGDLDAGAEAVARGLEHAPDVTYFRGHLLEVQGLLEEARANRLVDAGDAPGAIQARERAIALLEEVVRIQDQVIQRSLAAREAGAAAPAASGPSGPKEPRP